MREAEIEAQPSPERQNGPGFIAEAGSVSLVCLELRFPDGKNAKAFYLMTTPPPGKRGKSLYAPVESWVSTHGVDTAEP